MKNLFLLLILMLIVSSIHAQNDEEKIVIKKENRIIVEEIDIDEDRDNEISIDVESKGDHERTIIIKISDDGDEEVIKWTDDGEIPDNVRQKLERKGVDIDLIDEEDNVFVFKSKGDKSPHKKHMRKRLHRDHEWVDKRDMRHEHRTKLGDAYIGAQIETSETGVGIVGVMVDSPSHKGGLKKGDVVTQINGANTKNMRDMLTLLGFFDPEDQVEVLYLRDGKEQKTKITLAKRPDSYK